MADPRLVVARRELARLRSEKTIVLALLIQLFIAAFSSFLVVGLVSMYDPGSVDGYQVETAVTGDAREDLLAVMAETEGVDGEAYENPSLARSAFHDNRVDAVLRAEHSGGRVSVTAIVPDSDIRTTLVVVQLRDVLRSFERVERAERVAYLDTRPLDLPREGETSPYYGFTYTVLVPLLLFLPVFISGSIAVDSLTEERERGTLELLRVAPLTLADIVDGKVLAAAVLAPAQAFLWLLLLVANGTSIANLPLLVILVAAIATVVVTLAAAAGLLAGERRVAQLTYSLGTLVLVGGASVLPRGPVNLVARLALGSTGRWAVVIVAGYVLVAAAAYAVLRSAVTRLGVEP